MPRKLSVEKAQEQLDKAKRQEFLYKIIDFDFDISVLTMLESLEEDTGAKPTHVAKILMVKPATVLRWKKEDSNRPYIYMACFWIRRQFWYDNNKVDFGFDED